VTAGLGTEVESLVAEYTQLEWSRRRAQQILEELDSLDAHGRQLLLLRLANELEDHLDLGILYCSDAPRRLRKIDDTLHVTVELANRLGHGTLANALAGVFEQSHAAQLPPHRSGEKTTFHLAPRSHCIRPGLQVRQRVRALLQALRRR
jgi:hypothetical protein